MFVQISMMTQSNLDIPIYQQMFILDLHNKISVGYHTKLNVVFFLEQIQNATYFGDRKIYQNTCMVTSVDLVHYGVSRA